MNRRALRALAATLVATAALAVAAAGARGALVEVRVDTAAGSTLFDGTIETAPHAVDGGDGSGTHPCAGGSGAPAATATGALDDALRASGITWRGNWDPSFHDFFVDRIGPWATAPPDTYWSLAVNGRFASGGCLARVASGDLVHFEYGSALAGVGAPSVGEPGAGEAPGTGGGGPASGVPTAPGVAPVSPPRIGALARRAAAFLRGHRGGPGAAWGRLALAVRDGRGPGAASRALLGDRLEAQRPDGSLAGETNATALAVLALGTPRGRRADSGRYGSEIGPSAGRRARAAARWLIRAQGTGGGLGYRPGVPPDVDTTALSTWALARAGFARAARRAAAFVAASQNDDGGFPSLSGGESNAQSTGLALVALRLVGPRPRLRSAAGLTPLAYLGSLARSDGSLEYALGAHPTPAWTTAQALLGFTGAAKLMR